MPYPDFPDCIVRVKPVRIVLPDNCLTMEDKRYYYKVSLADTKRGHCISEFIERGKAAAKAADELAEELGAESRTDRPGCLYPGVGIGSLTFRSVPNLFAYQFIGKGEYIPNMQNEKGQEIARRIVELPDVTSADFRVAFGIPINQARTPQWFIYRGKAYLCSRYRLGEEYEEILQQEFESKRKKV